MKGNAYLLTAGASMTLVLALLSFASSASAGSQETLIHVNGKAEKALEGPHVSPAKASVYVRSVATWVNHSDQEITITFLNGLECQPYTRDALEWRAGRGACYITGRSVPPNGTISAVFGETGPHEYAIRYAGGDHEERGTVVTFRGFGNPYGLNGF